ncbi:MAG: single-stranded DNA-binding protein [Actinobacteria bacterium]|jgi:single-strand DNA-binding protein|nr:single-stranded DNA-binding protein [Actinomycetota bacterium]
MARRPERETGPLNEVRLRGRLSGEPEQRELPSGDVVVGFRLVVDRPAAGRAPGRATVDTIDCAAFRAGPRRRVLACSPGDVIEVHGALHRRFYASPAGRASRYEVEALAVARAARAAPAQEQERGTMAG